MRCVAAKGSSSYQPAIGTVLPPTIDRHSVSVDPTFILPFRYLALALACSCLGCESTPAAARLLWLWDLVSLSFFRFGFFCRLSRPVLLIFGFGLVGSGGGVIGRYLYGSRGMARQRQPRQLFLIFRVIIFCFRFFSFLEFFFSRALDSRSIIVLGLGYWLVIKGYLLTEYLFGLFLSSQQHVYEQNVVGRLWHCALGDQFDGARVSARCGSFAVH